MLAIHEGDPPALFGDAFMGVGDLAALLLGDAFMGVGDLATLALLGDVFMGWTRSMAVEACWHPDKITVIIDN